MMKVSSFKKRLMAGVLLTTFVLSPVMAMADTGIAGWMGVILPAAGLVYTLYTLGTVAYMTAVNTDALQLAGEAMLYVNMMDVTYEWEPEPEESYEKAAEENENNSSVSTSTVTEEGALGFEVQSIQATGLEAVGLEGTPSAMISGRSTVMEKMTFLTSAGGKTTSKTDLTGAEKTTLRTTQTNNEQYLGTAGVARAELALMAAKQGAVDGSVATENTDSNENAEFQSAVQSGATKPQTLSGLIGQGGSTGAAMRVQILMNLELAQRLNLNDMLAGNSLSLKAARLLRESNPIN